MSKTDADRYVVDAETVEGVAAAAQSGTSPAASRAGGDGAQSAALPEPRRLHPGWFGAVMGTAIIAVAASLNPGHVASLGSPARAVSQTMAVIAFVLALGLIFPYVGRMVRHPDAALADLRNPTVGALYGTLPGGILVLAATFAAVGPTWFSAPTVRTVVASLDWVGVPLALAVSVLFAFLLFVRAELDPAVVNGSWFIPPVVTIVVPLVLTPLVPGASPTSARALLFLAYGFWGMGFLLYLVLLTMLYQRLTLHALPHAGLAPSLWIGLGPLGVGALALLKLAAVSAAVFGPDAAAMQLAANVVATMLWGFGAWWLLAAVVLLVHYLRSGPLPYGVGWWGFTFPLGAYTVATLALASTWSLTGLQWVGAGLFILLSCFWLVVVSGTVRSLSVQHRASRAPGTRGRTDP